MTTRDRTQISLTGSSYNPETTSYRVPVSQESEDIKPNTSDRQIFEEEHNASPKDIDLSVFHTPQHKRSSVHIATIAIMMLIAILAVIYGISKTINDKNGKTGWQKDYVLEETKKGTNSKYNIIGAKNNGNMIQLLLEQTSDDKEVTAKVTVIFYNSQNTALEAQSGNGTMHGKGTNCIIEIKPNVSFDHMNIISEE